MKLTIIAALNAKRVIGRNGSTPWHIPEDLQRFKQLTTGHTVVMGRKTFSSIGKPLPGRRNVVISRTIAPSPGIEIASTIDAAFQLCATEERIYIIGGGEIFHQTLEHADELLLTIVEDDSEGDTYFPTYEHLIGPMFIRRTTELHTGFRYDAYVRSDDRPAIG